MDGTRFDALARTLAATGSRRNVVRAMIAAAAASLLGAAKTEAWRQAGGPCNADGSCPLGQHCVVGVCECDSGLTICNGRCVNLQTDPANCGACGQHCQPGAPCAGGECACDHALCGDNCCPVPWFCDPVDHTCTANCEDGRRPCGIFMDNQPLCCPPGEACLDPYALRCGKCPSDTVVCSPHDSFFHRKNDCCHGTCCNEVCCETGKLCCGNVSCCDPTRGFACHGGACGCKEGYSPCDEYSYCADFQTDPDNCGACHHACPDGDACVQGRCCPAKRACHDRCCPLLQECCHDETCKLQGTCCPPERECGADCCLGGEQCCHGSCIPKGQECVCPEARDCSGAGLGCCAPGTVCAGDTDGNAVCCPTTLCGDDQYCCAADEVCTKAGICCHAGKASDDGGCCVGTDSPCGVDCCQDYEVCIEGKCCEKSRVAGGKCCPYLICNDKCCAADEGCLGLGVKDCTKFPPL
jgi:hypothetical protein